MPGLSQFRSDCVPGISCARGLPARRSGHIHRHRGGWLRWGELHTHVIGYFSVTCGTADQWCQQMPQEARRPPAIRTVRRRRCAAALGRGPPSGGSPPSAGIQAGTWAAWPRHSKPAGSTCPRALARATDSLSHQTAAEMTSVSDASRRRHPLRCGKFQCPKASVKERSACFSRICAANCAAGGARPVSSPSALLSGIGLVITVTAASTGVKNAQGKVLHALYGVGTDITVTQSPKAGSGAPAGFGFRGRSGASGGTKINADVLVNPSLGTLDSSTVTSISQLRHVSAAAGGLTLTDTKISGKIPKFSSVAGSRAVAGPRSRRRAGAGGTSGATSRPVLSPSAE